MKSEVMQYSWFKLLRCTRLKKTILARVPMFGWKMRVHARSFVGKLICRDGAWEIDNTRFLLKNLSLKQDDVAIDAGANIGWYSLLLDKIAAGSGARTLAFEPYPENFDWLVENLKRNNAKSVTAVRKGVSDKSGETTMYLEKDGGALSMLPLSNLRRGATQIESVALDEYLKGENIAPRRVRFVKMDIEGFELMALRGAAEVLQTCPLMMIEYAPRLMAQGNLKPRDVIDLMTANRYVPHYLIRGELHAAHAASLADENLVNIFWRKQ
ncbi:MAG: FkbM family methyltransferase [Gammaproteobacteria bacterium]